MDCFIKSNILVNAQKIAGESSTAGVQESTLSSKDVLKIVNDSTEDIGYEDYKERVKDRKLLSKALKKIKQFSEFGLIVPTHDNFLLSAASRFFNNVIRNKEHSVDFINRLADNGFVLGTYEQRITKTKEGYKTNKDVAVLNDSIKKYLGTRVVVQDSYISKMPDGTLSISDKFAEDFNNYKYSEYLFTVGLLAEQVEGETPKEYNEAVMYFKAAPIDAHIDLSIYAEKAKIKALKTQKSYNPLEEQKMEAKIQALKDTKKAITPTLTLGLMTNYLDDVLNDMRDALKKNSTFSLDTLKVYKETIKLVKSGANPRYSENTLLTYSELQQEDIFETMLNYSKEAIKLEAEVDEEISNIILKRVKGEFSQDLDDQDVKTISGLGGSWRRFFQNFLGLDHINNPIIKFIAERVDRAEIAANHDSRRDNDILDKLYKALDKTGFNKLKFFQKGSEGHTTGRLVDTFTSDWWSKKYKLYNNFVTRRKNTIALNPSILFPELDGVTGKEVEKETLIQEVYANLGVYMGDKYIEEARRLYKLYLNNLKVMESGNYENWLVKEQSVEQYILSYSPMVRIENVKKTKFNKKDANNGSDEFLLLIPRRKNKEGIDLGWYEQDYKDIEENSAAFAFYKQARDNYIEVQQKLGKYEERLKPPALAYIGKSVAEHVKNGHYKEAARLMKEDMKKKYSITEVLSSEEQPVDPITNKPKNHLQYEIHSIPQEIYRRVKASLDTNEVYNNLDLTNIDDQLEREQIRDAEYTRITEEVEKERSEDLLQSVVMADYAAKSFLHKQAIETEIMMARELLDSDILTSIDSNKVEAAKVKELAKNAVDYFLNKAFYDVHRKDYDSSITGDKPTTTEAITAITGKNVTNFVKQSARVLVLGWSLPHAIFNIGQQYFSSLMKGIEDGNFNLRTLHQAYGSIIKNKKDSSIVDRLYIVGDVAYSFKKRSIHERYKWLGKLNPMYLQTVVENLNQGTVAIAILKKLQVKDKNGKEASVYDALDSDGLLGEEFTFEDWGERGTDLMVKLTVKKIRPVVKQTAGDYLSPLLAEKYSIGELALMFKKWLPEMLFDRFHQRKYDEATGRYKEGRLAALVNATRAYATGNKSQVDRDRLMAARAGFAEIAIALFLKALHMFTAVSMCDTPECKDKRGPALYAINTLGRLSDDVISFISPGNLVQNLFNPFAVEGSFNDMTKFIDDASSYLLPFGDDGRYKVSTEDHEIGDLRLIPKLEKITPLYRTTKYNIDQLSKKLRADGATKALIKNKE